MRFRCVLKGEFYGCLGTCSFPQWCYTHQQPHTSEDQLTPECRIAPTCDPCERKLHDQCGRAPGFVKDKAIQPIKERQS